MRSLTAGQPFHAASDLVVSPTYTPDLVNGVLDLLVDGETGVWHLANEGALSWAEFAVRIGRACGLDERLVVPLPAAVLGWPAARPASVALASRRGRMMTSLDDAIHRFAHEHALITGQRPVRRAAGRLGETVRDEVKSFAPTGQPALGRLTVVGAGRTAPAGGISSHVSSHRKPS